jgi:hypothetical protein
MTIFLFSCFSPERFEPGHLPQTLPEVNTYDPNAVITVTGKVLETTGYYHEDGVDIATLIIETDKERYITYLGPVWFLTLKNAFYEKDDILIVEGSKFDFIEGEEEEEEEIEEDELRYFMLIARKVKKDDKTLYLRTKSGKPRWYKKGRLMGIERNIGKRRGLQRTVNKTEK